MATPTERLPRRRYRPTANPLYPVVQHHLETFLTQAIQAGLGLVAPQRPRTVTSSYLCGPPLGLQREAMASPATSGWALFDSPALFDGRNVRCRAMFGGAVQLVSGTGAFSVLTADGSDAAVHAAIGTTSIHVPGLLPSWVVSQAAWMGSSLLSHCARSVFTTVNIFSGSSDPVLVLR
jgi:hypothetical protein